MEPVPVSPPLHWATYLCQGEKFSKWSSKVNSSFFFSFFPFLKHSKAPLISDAGSGGKNGEAQRETERERDESGGNEKVTGPTVTGTAVFQIPTLPDSQGMNN